MKTYIYKGQNEIELPGQGIVKPGQEIKSDKNINHPLFEEKKEEFKKKLKKIKS